jgi:hypothetical protein
VPSRNRPAAARELAEVFAATVTSETGLLIVVDEDDPADYTSALDGTEAQIAHASRQRATWGMVPALNQGVAWVAAEWRPAAMGFMGDDHRPRTRGWDEAYLDALREMKTGMVYGNDLYQGEKLPTQIAMTTNIVQALGYMVSPELWHLYVDNYWLTLGQQAGCIRYLPSVIIEHMHPFAGKAKTDDGYRLVNSDIAYQFDRGAYTRVVESGRLAGDVAKIRALRAGDA